MTTPRQVDVPGSGPKPVGKFLPGRRQLLRSTDQGEPNQTQTGKVKENICNIMAKAT